MKVIPITDLVAIKNSHCLRVDCAYSKDDNLLFGERIYRKDARVLAHKDIARIVNLAAEMAYEEHHLRLVVYDCLRTTDAQAKMLKTQRVKDNPHWLEEPRLLSPPGAGGHPRGMAIDVALEALSLDGENSVYLDMGTEFDYLAENSAAEYNPAHREHPDLTQTQKENRALLDTYMLGAAQKLGIPLIGLPQEWWDYRMPAEIYEQYAPLSDNDLPPAMRMISP